MNPITYDPTSPESILEFAKGLTGKTLAEAVDMSGVQENMKHKGKLGTMVEQYYFGYDPNSEQGPDFAEAGVELKTTGVKKKSDGSYMAKERLSLTMIDYMKLAEEDWSNSSLMFKSRLMLLLFYLYEKNIPKVDLRFILNPLLFTFPEEDLIIIKRDWEMIQDKVKAGKAHELSEGDTFYLGACRKGKGGPSEKLREQPFPGEPAKARAFSLKPNYMTRIINGHAAEAGALDSALVIDEGIEAATKKKFEPYLGMSVEDIADMLGFYKNGKNDKGYYRNLTMRILGGAKLAAPELDKAGIELKTIRVDINWVPKESMSFPGFKYLDIIEEEWEESVFFSKIEQKFLFVIYRYDADDTLRFEGVKYWNMPYEDRKEAQKVWEETKRRVMIDARKLPGSKESPVAHVRPKGKNKRDVLITPQGTMLPKQCFWLNKGYIANQLV
ncbi:DNA mismatch repair protein [Candidatus Saccharibacteria bacterium]|nr:DNA mismatch repair protein [Candidatus Saccharibacteria bacterium]